jgi:hypothetical protein
MIFLPAPLKIGFFVVQRKDSERTIKWALAINRKNTNDSLWMPSKHSLLCGHHFVSGQPTDDPRSVDFIPSQFPTNHITNPKTEKDQDRFERVNKRQTTKENALNDSEQVLKTYLISYPRQLLFRP